MLIGDISPLWRLALSASSAAAVTALRWEPVKLIYMFNFWCEYRSWPWLETHKGILDRSKFKVTRDRSPTISGWLLVLLALVSYLLMIPWRPIVPGSTGRWVWSTDGRCRSNVDSIWTRPPSSPSVAAADDDYRIVCRTQSYFLNTPNFLKTV